MKSKKLTLILLAAILLGVSSCAQELCPAYAKVDKEEKKDKKESQF